MADPMAMGRVFKDNKGRINSVDFHRTHDFLVAGHDAGFISIYGTYEGRKITSLDCSKYGVAHICFTHHPKCLLHASTARSVEPVHDHALRYLSHHDNRYLRFFKGHTDTVTSLSLSPKSDSFISTALDKRLLMWDLRVAQAQACMDVPGQPHGVMDEEGLVFAVACGGSGLVSLFDARSYAGGPFLSFPLPLQEHKLPDAAPVTCLKFSTNQQHLLAVVDGRIFIMDTFDGREVVCWDTGVRDSSTPAEASFSPDGSYVMAGTADNHIKVWKCPPVPEDENAPPPPLTEADRHPIATWPTPHPCLPICAKWSPTRKLAVSACRALCMWIPDESGQAQGGTAPQQHPGYG